VLLIDSEGKLVSKTESDKSLFQVAKISDDKSSITIENVSID
jgi:hypothetical protein